ncbi:acetyl-CoA acetyltransferase [Halomonas campisalis]|uniref:Acetyl-CoA acetyltransferase n=1 Tax=Billgrantia campisalis TaxID=74661 RepID=A0ABS9PEP1_9GAMM|nr:acetyl-CoA acetyltransferase [Halomonas campisalis]MCG6659595.1 acetyl-CoA acetyltransferase [Halomonas campisalis]MDR5864556.1 acetyl-CoA acetyltransferase [Halomonas campisalis]
MKTRIIGVSHSQFGKLEASLETLIADAASAALADAGVEARDIDAIYVGQFNSGMCAQEFPASLALQADPDLRFKPATRCENACASGSAALYQGINLIEGGLAKRVLVIGAEKMTEASPAAIAEGLLGASYRPESQGVEAGFAGIFAEVARAYFERYGDHAEALARIAAKNHANGTHNPLAQLRKDLGVDFCREVSDKNPVVAAPLKRTDCSPVSDGAAAMVLTHPDAAPAGPRQVRFRAKAQVTDFMPLARRDLTRLEGAGRAWQQVLASADLSLDDLSLAEVHDCFTIAELMIYEAMGLTPSGQGARAINEGWVMPDGRLPINPSGGLKSKGHPVGATGVSMHVLAARQLLGEATGVQIPDARLAAVFNMGGMGVANYASILERVID